MLPGENVARQVFSRNHGKNRRDFLKLLCVGGSAMMACPQWLRAAGPVLHDPMGPSAGDPWDAVPQILSRIKSPSFPARDFVITKFGAVGDGKLDCTDAIRTAIETCSAAGGGRVVVPEGEFITGAVHLKSHVNLHISSGATLRFTRDTKKYPLVFTRWEGVELMNYSPFLYAFEQENIGVSGAGTLDGNADCEHWWPWKGRGQCGWKQGVPDQEADRKVLFDMAERGVPVQERVFGEGHYLRPQLLQFYRCKNVLIEGVTLKNSPMWQIHPVLCVNVTVRKVTLTGASANHEAAPNTDGCDPESCTDVLIEDCDFNTGDDCIAINSGRNADGRRLNVPSENIVVRNCRMNAGHGGVAIGSQISGGVRNVFVENCQMGGSNLWFAIRIKNNAMRGGLLENIYARNINIRRVAQAGLAIDFFYEEGEFGKFIPVVRNIELRNLSTEQAMYAFYLRGFKNAPITGVRLVDCDLRGIQKPSVIENVQELDLHNVRVNGKMAGSIQPSARLQGMPEMEFA